MPQRLKKPCSHPGCPELVPAGQTYCEKHRKKVKGQRDKQYNEQQRVPRARKFYSSRTWQKVRNRYIKQHPLCEHCKKKELTTVADEVDHIVPIEVDWSKRYNSENLQSLCHSCHMKKTNQDKKKYDL